MIISKAFCSRRNYTIYELLGTDNFELGTAMCKTLARVYQKGSFVYSFGCSQSTKRARALEKNGQHVYVCGTAVSSDSSKAVSQVEF
jgi:isocitrate lyase